MSRFILAVFLFLSLSVAAQNSEEPVYSPKKQWFLSSTVGMQMSGIKSEDFISSNYTPAFSLSAGVWFTNELAFQLSYKGFYFNTISDDVKHHYNFIYGELVFNLNEMINGSAIWDKKWSLLIHPGTGVFYNKHFDSPNICANIGLMASYKISTKFELLFDASGIFGYDIYQGDDDILPSLAFGLRYSFQN